MRLNVISLPARADRRAQFAAWNARPGTEIAFVDAVVGAALDRTQLIAEGLVSADASHFSAGALGNALSHHKLWLQAAAASEPTFIFEDDACLRADFAAQAAGARSVFQTTLRADASAVSTGPTFSFGIGGFGGSGGYGSGVGGGVGVAMPVGGSGGTGLATSSTLVDAAGSGKVIWSARATAPAATDLSAQIDELANVLVGALKQAALF